MGRASSRVGSLVDEVVDDTDVLVGEGVLVEVSVGEVHDVTTSSRETMSRSDRVGDWIPFTWVKIREVNALERCD